jgi:predicted metalloprotease with PDZ domain
MRLRQRIVFAFVLCASVDAWAQSSVAYRLTFPAPEHRWMQVEMTLTDLPPGPLELHVSRSSPGRYALHEFAKNVYDVQITDNENRSLAITRPNLHQWRVASPGPTVRVSYKVFGDRLDGTYLAVDSTHAHINMPAAIMWAKGLEMRPITIRFEPPAGSSSWQVATQLLPGSDARTFTAPNLQYLMDSPSEFGNFALQTFTVEDGGRTPTFRVAVHHQGADADVREYARDAEKIVREARTIFGTFPAFEGGRYTFIADYLPWAVGDGMEHRNSTVLTSSASLAAARAQHMSAVAHEFFHSWNVERIRPKSLEPFNFDDANVSSDLWLAEGVTNYYGAIILKRAGLMQLSEYATDLADTINTVTLGPGRRIRTAEEMSAMAPLVDAATSIDRNNFGDTFISYYTWGEAIGLALDLTLRDRSDGKITLDHVMRALWQRFGTSSERIPGYVERPYTIDDVKAVLTEVSGDPAFAEDFLARYVQGHEVADYRRLLARAGLILRPARSGIGYAGEFQLQTSDGRVRVGSVTAGSPAYLAGLERDDVLVSIAGASISSQDDVSAVVRRHKPGAMIPIVFQRRGTEVKAMLQIVEDPRQEVVTAESAKQPLTDAQRRFRAAWLSTN